jgi:SPP1 family predicted phage head-tail adaptor
MYRPRSPFTTVVELHNCVTEKVLGVVTKKYTKVDDIFCTFKTYGGTETTSNDLLVVNDTAEIETWYRPDITSSSQIKLGDKLYEVIGQPENIEMRNQFMKFKVQAVRGDA